MIEHITITVGCDRNLHCGAEEIHQVGPDVDFDLLAEALTGRDWIVTDDEYICPACVPAYEAEQVAESGATPDLIEAAPDLLAFARRVMADHRAQLPSEARDLYGGGCGCPQCEQARAAIAKAEGRA